MPRRNNFEIQPITDEGQRSDEVVVRFLQGYTCMTCNGWTTTDTGVHDCGGELIETRFDFSVNTGIVKRLVGSQLWQRNSGEYFVFFPDELGNTPSESSLIFDGVMVDNGDGTCNSSLNISYMMQLIGSLGEEFWNLEV